MAEHTGLMCAFVVPPAYAAQLHAFADTLDLPADAERLPVTEYHITLAYVKQEDILPLPEELPGDVDPDDGTVTPADVGDTPELRAAAVLDDLVVNLPPLVAQVTSLWRFSPSDDSSDGKDVLVALVASDGLVDLREQLVDALIDADMPPQTDKTYTPHITLAYVPRAQNSGLGGAVDVAIGMGNPELLAAGLPTFELDGLVVRGATDDAAVHLGIRAVTQAESDAAYSFSEALAFADEQDDQPDDWDQWLGGVLPSDLPAGLGLSFDMLNPEVVSWVKLHAAEMVQNITVGQQDMIRTLIHNAFVNGVTPQATARQVRQLIGLTPQQSSYVANYATRLQAANVPQAVADGLLAKYTNRWIAMRAMNIAQHELMAASVGGQQMLWQQATKAGYLPTHEFEQTWIVTPDDRLCPQCRKYQNMRAPLGGVFPNGYTGPPAPHVRCRCAIGIVAKEAPAAQHVMPPAWAGHGTHTLAPPIPKKYQLSEAEAQAYSLMGRLGSGPERVPAGQPGGGQFTSHQVAERINASGQLPGGYTATPAVAGRVAIKHMSGEVAGQVQGSGSQWTAHGSNGQTQHITPEDAGRAVALSHGGNRAQVFPAFTGGEAEARDDHGRWAGGAFYHGTTDERADRISKEGFALEQSSANTGNHGAFGYGVYLSPESEKHTAAGYGTKLLETRVDVKNVVPPERVADFMMGAIKAGHPMNTAGYSQHITDAAKAQGYDALMSPTHELLVFDPKNVHVVGVSNGTRRHSESGHWDEAEHPRAPDGKFGSGTGGSTAHTDWGDRAGEIAAAKTSPQGMHDEAVLRSAYEGTFAGLTTKIDEDNSFYNDDKGKFNVRGSVVDPNGKRVGSWSRMVSEDGKTVEHHILQLEPEVQGHGFAREFNRNAENHYIANGVQQVGIHADIDVGGYAWAKQGFDFADAHQRERTAGHAGILLDDTRFQIAHGLAGRDKENERQAIQHQIDSAEHSWDLAAIPVVGKDFMLGSDWLGKKSLDPHDETAIVGEYAYQSKKK